MRGARERRRCRRRREDGAGGSGPRSCPGCRDGPVPPLRAAPGPLPSAGCRAGEARPARSAAAAVCSGCEAVAKTWKEKNASSIKKKSGGGEGGRQKGSLTTKLACTHQSRVWPRGATQSLGQLRRTSTAASLPGSRQGQVLNATCSRSDAAAVRSGPGSGSRELGRKAREGGGACRSPPRSSTSSPSVFFFFLRRPVSG